MKRTDAETSHQVQSAFSPIQVNIFLANPRARRRQDAGTYDEQKDAGVDLQETGRSEGIVQAFPGGCEHRFAGGHRACMVGGPPRRRLPSGKHPNHADQRSGVAETPVPCRYSTAAGYRDDNQPADCRPEHAGDVHVHRVQRHCRFKLARLDQFRQHSQQCGVHHGIARANGEKKGEQDPRRIRRQQVAHREHAQKAGRQHHPQMGDNQQLAAVDAVGQRAGEEHQERNWQRGGRKCVLLHPFGEMRTAPGNRPSKAARRNCESRSRYTRRPRQSR